MMKLYLLVIILCFTSCKEEVVQTAYNLKYEEVLPVKVEIYSFEDCSKFKRLIDTADLHIYDIVYLNKKLTNFRNTDYEKYREIIHSYSSDDIALNRLSSSNPTNYSNSELIRISTEISLVKALRYIEEGDPVNSLNEVMKVIRYVIIANQSNDFDDIVNSTRRSLPMLIQVIKNLVKKYPNTISKLRSSNEWKALSEIKASRVYSRFLRSSIVYLNARQSNDKYKQHNQLMSKVLPELELKFVNKDGEFTKEVDFDDMEWMKNHVNQWIRDSSYVYLSLVMPICELYLLDVYLFSRAYKYANGFFPKYNKLDNTLLVDLLNQKINYKYKDADTEPLIFYDVMSTDYGRFLSPSDPREHIKTVWSIKDRVNLWYYE